MSKSQLPQGPDNKTILSTYFYEINNIPMLSPEEEVKIAQKIRRGNKHAMAILVQANLRFVVRVALQYRNQGLPLEDLINEGNLGLIKAARKFDETKGFKFISYAVWWIRQSILQALAEDTRVVRVPINRVNMLGRIGRTHEMLQQAFEREPTSEEIAECMEMSEVELSRMYQIPGKLLSLDSAISDSEKCTLLEITANDDFSAPDHQVNEESLRMDLDKVFRSLTGREAEILKMYFGIDRQGPMTFEEIGKKMKLTRERVRQIKEKALVSLRHHSRSRALRQYLS